MKKLLIWVTLIAIIATAIIVGWVIIMNQPIKAGSKITEEQLVSNINKIIKEYTKNRYSNCEILTAAEKLMVADDTNMTRFENMNSNERIIYITAVNNLNADNHPREIYAIFESYIFMRNKVLPYNVMAISCFYKSGHFDDTRGLYTTIFLNEYQEIYNSTDIKGLSESEAAKKLANKWIEKTGYARDFSLKS